MKPEKVYACYNKDKEARLSSSSGAVFTSLADYVLNKDGIVYGVAMSEDCYSANFIAVTDEFGMKRLRKKRFLGNSLLFGGYASDACDFLHFKKKI